MEAISKFLGGLMLILLLVLYNAFSWGFVSYKAYNWLVLPSIALPHYSINQFTGFTLFLSIIMPVVYTQIDDKYLKSKETRYFIHFSLPWLSLFVAWVVSYFI